MKKLVLAAVTMAAASGLMVGSGQSVAGEEVTTGRGHYESVNGLRMYYEVHGRAKGRPLVLIHGAFSATDTSFGKLLPSLAKHRRIISVEQQGHGHTADIDRPLRVEQMAEDTAALLHKIGVDDADVLGYSMGSAVALHLGLRHPDLVNRLVLAAITYHKDGFHPGLPEMMEQLRPEHLYGSPFHEEYLRIAPRPEDFPRLVEQVKDMNRSVSDLPDGVVRSLRAPAMIVIGDSDIVRPEHSVELFRLLGGGVNGDVAGMPKSRLAVLPGASHVTLVHQAEVLPPMIRDFLDAN